MSKQKSEADLFLSLQKICEQRTKDKTLIELAYRIDQINKPEKLLTRFDWYYEPKYDGIRCVLIDGCPTSRYGNTLNFPYLFDVQLPAEFRDLCLDGELFAGTPYATVAVKRYRTELPDLSKFTYHVFDIVPSKTLLPPHRTYDKSYLERKELLREALQALFKDYPKLKQIVKFVEYKHLKVNQDKPERVVQEAYDIANKYIKKGFEGIMLKRADSVYKPKRTRDWIKVKESVDIDANIIDFIRGTGKYKNALGALVVKPREGQPAKHIFKVGTGFTDEQRFFIWEHKDKLKGLPITVVAQSVTETGKARMPVFKYFRLDLISEPEKRLGKELIEQMCEIQLFRPDDCALKG